MNIAAVNLNLLPVLDALLAERNVSRAGKRLGLSQPAVSNALAQLRSVLGDPLLVRGPKGMVPTERALAMAGPLRAALGALEHGLEPPTVFDAASVERSFTILTTDFVAFVMLPRLLARLEREAPRVRLQVRAWQEHRVPPDLERGEGDLMFGFYRTLPPGYQEERLFEDKLVAVARKGHPAIRGKLSLATYLAQRHVLATHQPDGRGVIDDVLATRSLERTVALRVSHFLLVPPVVAATDYVAAISGLVAHPLAEPSGLQLLKLPITVPTVWVRMLWHERTHASPAHVWLRRVVSDVAGDVRSACATVKQLTARAAAA